MFVVCLTIAAPAAFDIEPSMLLRGVSFAIASLGIAVLQGAGFLLGTWAGVPIGLALYAGCRIFAPREEAGSPARSGRRGLGTARR